MSKQQENSKEKKRFEYLRERLAELGVSDDQNTIKLRNGDLDYPANQLGDWPVFDADKHGNITIQVYDLNRNVITYEKKGTGKMSQINARIVPYVVTRFKEPLYNEKKGETIKYSFPKGQGTFPFFPPGLVDKYEKKTKIKTLILTEGYFKAFKGWMEGLDIVGLSSITHYKDSQSGLMHHDIIKLIGDCKVDNVIWLQDGDCRDISSSALEENKDLYTRPAAFFQSARQVRDLLLDHVDNIYYAHINSSELDGRPKGLDDLYVETSRIKADEAAEASSNSGKKKAREEAGKDACLQISAELTALGKKENAGHFFWKTNISAGLSKLRVHFHIDKPESFFEFHQAQLQERTFLYHGTKYQYDLVNNDLKVMIPAEAKLYFRVADHYHKLVEVPNKHGDLERVVQKRQKQTIIDDHGKGFTGHVPKYEAFCNVPDHSNYQEVIHNCYNLYAPLTHEPEEGDITATMGLLEHIFGKNQITYEHPKTGEKATIKEIDLGLDYLQLLFTKPTQKLPILCLVSRENKTGKTTFAELLKAIFMQNMAVVGNADLADNFNASWASKLIVCCDEAKIDKQIVVEKIKSLSTADKIFMNAKGKDHVEIDFFGKFILLTNNEENFIYASDDDTRYWIRKVPRITREKMNVNLKQEIRAEIPAFLHFLSKRKLSTERLDRMWFDGQLIKTDALKKVVLHSAPVVEKEIRQHIKEMFLDFGVEEIRMSINDIKDEFFRHQRFEKSYIAKVLEDMGVERYKNEDGKYVSNRYSYPRWEPKVEGGESVMQFAWVRHSGRPYVFWKKDFVTKEEADNTVVEVKESTPETKDPVKEEAQEGLPF